VVIDAIKWNHKDWIKEQEDAMSDSDSSDEESKSNISEDK